MTQNQALAVKPANTLINTNIDDLFAVADMIFKSHIFGDIQSKEAAAVKILGGSEYGFSPMQSQSMFDFIQNRVVLNSHGKATLINSSGDYRMLIKELTATNCSIDVLRKNDQGEWKVIANRTFSMQDAKDAGYLEGKNAHNYKKHPRNMLFARNVSNIWRWDCAELNTRRFSAKQIQEFSAPELEAENTVDGELIEAPTAREVVEAHDPETGEVIEVEAVIDGQEFTGTPEDAPNSIRVDMIEAINSLITEKIGGMPNDRKIYLKGRVLENESPEALELMYAELEAM